MLNHNEPGPKGPMPHGKGLEHKINSFLKKHEDDMVHISNNSQTCLNLGSTVYAGKAFFGLKT